MKYCRSCQTKKPIDNFAPRAQFCTECQAASAAERRQYLANWRKVNGAAAQREWRKRNPGYDKEYYRRKKTQ